MTSLYTPGASTERLRQTAACIAVSFAARHLDRKAVVPLPEEDLDDTPRALAFRFAGARGLFLHALRHDKSEWVRQSATSALGSAFARAAEATGPFCTHATFVA